MSVPPAVLLVEDDPTAQSIALCMLRHLGIEADAASDGGEGVRMAAEQAYDLILMDIQLPVMDGVEALRAIRSASGGSRPRVVAMTDSMLPGAEKRMAGIGFDRVVPKPFSIPLLREAVWPSASAPVAEAVASHGCVEDDPETTLMRDIRAHVRSLLGEDDDAFVADLVQTFAESTQKTLEHVASLHSRQDLPSLARAAHAIKGSAANVGLQTLAEAWGSVEAGARQDDEAVLGASLAAAMDLTRRAICLV